MMVNPGFLEAQHIHTLEREIARLTRALDEAEAKIARLQVALDATKALDAARRESKR